MAINIGSRSIAKIIVEKMEVAKVYIGDMMVYGRTVGPTLPLPLTFVAEQANSKVALTKNGSPAWAGEYSLDNENWLTYVPSETGYITLANVGDKVYFRGNISANFSTSNYLKFVMSGTLGAEGNVNSMYVAVGFEELETLTYTSCYSNMFKGCSALTTAPTLPATTLSNYCYQNMFQLCSALTTAPTLPATTLASACYDAMFYACTALTTAPELPATVLKNYCYQTMFSGCTALTTAPELPATTLKSNCYYYMFKNCTVLTTAPELPATTLAGNCYSDMFNGCTLIKVSLTKEDIYQNTWQFGDTLSSTYASNMFANTGGTFTGTPTVDVVYTSNSIQ